MDYSKFAGKRVLVTGASGLIGSHLVDRLLEIGASVYSMEHREPVKGMPCKGSIENYEGVHDIVFNSRPEYVFHLAAQAIVIFGEEMPKHTLDTNVTGALNLFSALRIYNNQHPSTLHGVIVAATDKVYGRQEHLPYTEDMPLLGVRQVYEASKVCEDVLAQMAAWSWGLPISITRFGNVYGPRDENLTRIVPGTINSYLKGEAPVIRSDGQAYRDYIYIDDVVDGYLRLADYSETIHRNIPTGPIIFNFGTGKFSRVLDIVAAISEHFPNSQPPEILYEAKDEIRKQYVSGALAKKVLGWEPKTSLRDGIAETVKWWKEQYAKSN